MQFIIDNKEFTHQQLMKQFNIPENSAVDGCNLVHSNSHREIEKLRFLHFIQSFPVDQFSGKSYSKLYDNLVLGNSKFKNIDIFDNSIVNVESLRNIGFGPKTSKLFIENFQEKYKKNGIELWRIIKSLGVDGCGISTSKEFSKYLSDVEYSFESKTREVINQLHHLKHDINSMIESLQKMGYSIVYPQNVEKTSQHQIKYMLTGSPKSAGFATKSIFKDKLNSGEEVGNIKVADILITDDLSSNSSKMKSAHKLGIRIMTYSDAIIELNQ